MILIFKMVEKMVERVIMYSKKTYICALKDIKTGKVTIPSGSQPIVNLEAVNHHLASFNHLSPYLTKDVGFSFPLSFVNKRFIVFLWWLIWWKALF